MLDRMPERAVSDPTQAPEKSPTWPTGFMVLHGNRLEDLRHLLIEHVRRFPLPGLEPEWVVLQSTGMKQWLEQGLASQDRKSTRLNSSHIPLSRMPSSA